jgi:hypothetical protein
MFLMSIGSPSRLRPDPPFRVDYSLEKMKLYVFA